MQIRQGQDCGKNGPLGSHSGIPRTLAEEFREYRKESADLATYILNTEPSRFDL